MPHKINHHALFFAGVLATSFFLKPESVAGRSQYLNAMVLARAAMLFLIVWTVALLAYLQKANEVRAAVLDRPRDDIPVALRGNDHGIALFGLVKKVFDGIAPTDQGVALAQETAQTVLAVLSARNVVDFWRNLDAMNQTRIELDHFLYDVVGAERGVKLSAAQMDAVIDQSLALAKARGINA